MDGDQRRRLSDVSTIERLHRRGSTSRDTGPPQRMSSIEYMKILFADPCTCAPQLRDDSRWRTAQRALAEGTLTEARESPLGRRNSNTPSPLKVTPRSSQGSSPHASPTASPTTNSRPLPPKPMLMASPPSPHRATQPPTPRNRAAAAAGGAGFVRSKRANQVGSVLPAV